MKVLCILLALVLDRVLGEPRRAHPLVGFGVLARATERAARQTLMAPTERRLRSADGVIRAIPGLVAGTVAWSILVLVPTAVLALVQARLPDVAQWLLAAIVLYFCVGYRSLEEHCLAVVQPLAHGDLADARRALSMIVSRDTRVLDAEGLSRGTLESLLENGSDAVVAPVFWFAVAGAPGALGYRLANTLDAMWGYRNKTYRHFGWCAAKADDLLNLVPARLCALAYAFAGNTKEALACWSSQAAAHDSPNAGPVMAAGAGALGVRLGGPARYEGVERWRPILGSGSSAQPSDVARALRLLRTALAGLLLLCLAVEVVW